MWAVVAFFCSRLEEGLLYLAVLQGKGRQPRVMALWFSRFSFIVCVS